MILAPLGPIANVLGPIIKQIGWTVLRERLVRKVAAETIREIGDRVGGRTKTVCYAAADEIDPPKERTSLPPAA